MSFYDYPIYRPAQDTIPANKLSQVAGAISIYVNKGEYETNEQQLLSKIISATGNNISDIKVIEVKPGENIAIQQSWNAEKGLDIIFGVESKQLMLQSETHHYFPIHIEKRTLFFCDSLTILSTDADKKKALWGCLKTYFEI